MSESRQGNSQTPSAAGAARHAGYVAIIGPTNAGKSTLLNTIIGRKISIVSSKVQTTRNRILGVHTSDKGQIVFIDTPGYMRRAEHGGLNRLLEKSVSEAVKEVDLTVLVLDAAAIPMPKLGQVLEPECLFQGFSRKLRQTPDVVLLNKIDLFPRDKLLPIIANLSSSFAKVSVEMSDTAPGEIPVIIPVSAESGDGVDHFIDYLLKKLPQGENFFPEDFVTDQEEQFFVTEIIREKAFRLLNKELPYSVAVCIEHWEETDKGLGIFAEILVEREGQKKIVIGQGGSKLKAIGSQAREELEKRFDCRIYLELRVKVAENWTSSERGWQRAGYRKKL
ncbi:MAG: GTPase Era [bacterium]|nr:GTPase Era [bacterium]